MMYCSAFFRSSHLSSPWPGCGHHHLRVLLEVGRDDAQRNVLLHGVEGLQQVAAHVEVDLAGQQQRPPADLRAALHDGDVEAAGRIGAVGDRLIVAAMLGLGEPVGAERDLFVGERARAEPPGWPRHATEILNFLFIDTTLLFARASAAAFDTNDPRSKTHAMSSRAPDDGPLHMHRCRICRRRIASWHRAYFLDASPSDGAA